MMQHPMRVAVIGAGIAGLSVAKQLQAAGLNVHLFEKSRGPSGRMSTRVTEQWQCDHGAQYFTARDPLFHAEVERWQAADVAKVWRPRLAVYDGVRFLPKTTHAETETVRYVGYPKNNAPAQWLARTLNLQSESTVTQIQQFDGKWQIKTAAHGLHPEMFDITILAIPAPQAANLLHTTTSNAYALSQAVVMQPCFALMVQLATATPISFDGLFINTGCLSWLARDSAKPGRTKSPQANTHKAEADTWILHATSAWSQAHVNADTAQVTQLMMMAFERIIQKDFEANAQPTTAIQVKSTTLHRWLYADCTDYLTQTYHFDAMNQIGLCGDWLNGGKVQGAWLSGFKLAQHIIKAHVPS